MFTKSAAWYDIIYAWKDYAAEAERLHAWSQQHQRSPGNRLLDVACGTGAHIAHLRQWYASEGLDLDPALLDIARQRNPGIPFHQGDMVDFKLDRQFDVVVCLFGSIGYVRTLPRLRQALQTLRDHALPGGLVIVEPWLTPEQFQAGRPSARFVDEPELKIARVNISSVEDGLSVFDFHYLVARPGKIEHFIERHELALFSHDDYLTAFRLSGLAVTHDPEGLTGRGLYLGLRPAA